jgi:Raf kinase inhibitor-like YbhB/YbcL family protein
MILTSSAFREGELIPSRYTCDGENVSPPLEWDGIPEGTRSLALVVDDPDAPSRTFVHWVLYHLPASVRELAEGVGGSEVIKIGAMQGRNDFHKVGYGGPCPPSGTHRYFFRLYALNAPLELHAGATGKELESAMKGRIAAEAQLMGRYARRKK